MPAVWVTLCSRCLWAGSTLCCSTPRAAAAPPPLQVVSLVERSHATGADDLLCYDHLSDHGGDASVLSAGGSEWGRPPVTGEAGEQPAGHQARLSTHKRRGFESRVRSGAAVEAPWRLYTHGGTTSPWGLESRLESRAKAAARLVLEVSAVSTSPSSRGLWGCRRSAGNPLAAPADSPPSTVRC